MSAINRRTHCDTARNFPQVLRVGRTLVTTTSGKQHPIWNRAREKPRTLRRRRCQPAAL